MATHTTSTDAGTRALWVLTAVAALFFVVLMVFAIYNAQDSSPSASEITPAEGEQGPEGEG